MLPDQPGTYALIMHLVRRATITVGRMGEFSFSAGWYAYVGSARGPGGLAARISHHCRESKRHHWHIDYLSAYARPIAVWYTLGQAKRECSWAQALTQLPGASIPAFRFGASDCRCQAHLIRFPTQPDLAAFAQFVESSVFERAPSA